MNHSTRHGNPNVVRYLKQLSFTILVTLLLLNQELPLPTTPPTASAAITTNVPLRVALLGDSYSAGNGAGHYYGDDKTAYRSSRNWAHNYVNWLNDQGAHAILNNVAHSGHVSDDVLSDQMKKLDSNTNLVMFTIGGNDVNFSDIVSQCFMIGMRDPATCRQKIDAANSKLPRVKKQTLDILQAIDNRLDDNAQVVIVGYPRLSSKDDFTLRDSHALWTDSYNAGAAIRKLGDDAKIIQSDLVSEWNKSHSSLKVTYVDGVVNSFNGHEPDPSFPLVNPHRWINEFFETEGQEGRNGDTQAKTSWDSNEFYHPNLVGHEEIAKLIEAKVGVPSIESPKSNGEDIDIAFVVDSTGSMDSNVEAVRSKINSIAEETSKKALSYRFALVDYKDHPQYDPKNYLARTDVDFTSDIPTLDAGLSSLTYDGGNLGNTNASVYSGVMQAVNLKWRNGVKKIVVVIGDAPPRDPEPGTGYTAASVAKAAYEVDPVSVYGIDTGQLSSSDFQTLVSSSSGTTANASSPDQVSDLVNKAISSELNKPFAWIQGPYVAKVGDPVDIDAAASHAVSGSLTSYEWDFNGDGVYDETGTSPRITHTFSEEFSGVIGLRVTQSDGQTAVAITQVDITDDGDNTPRDQDNCPDVSNWGQTDYDNDGVGDECDPDPGFPTQDKPGVCVVGENCPPDTGTPSVQPTPAPSGGSTPTPAVAPAPTQAPTAAPTTTASKRPLPNTGINASRLAALAILGLLAGAAVLHHRRKVTS